MPAPRDPWRTTAALVPLATTLMAALLALAGCSAGTQLDGTQLDAAYVGRSITLVGSVSDQPWQHVMGHVQGKTAVYVDHGGDKQTVAYVKDEPACVGDVELTGRVMEVSFPSKGHKTPRQMMREYHLDVSSHRCVE